MTLPNHAAFRVELAEILANAAALYTRIRQYRADQEMHQGLTDYPIPGDLAIEFAEKQQHFEGELDSILGTLVSKYQETPLSILECFYFPGDAEDVENYGQALMDWTSDIRKHLIQLKAETAKMLRDKENDPEILIYEQRLKNIYDSVVKFEHRLKIKYKPSIPRQDLAPPKPNDSVSLTERLDGIRNNITTFQASRPEFSSRLCEIQQRCQLESLQSSLSSPSSIIIFQAVNSIISECLPHLLSKAKSEYQQVLADNEEAFRDYLGRKLKASSELIEVVLGVTNSALMSVLEEGELIE